VLRIDPTARRVRSTVDEVATIARDTFRTTRTPWSRALYFSPDLMVAAAGADAFRRGEFHAVLGEVHSTNSLLWSSLVAQHPNRDALVEAVTCDTGNCLVVCTQVRKEDWLARTAPSVYGPTAGQYQFGDDLPNVSSCSPLPAAMFVAIDTGTSIMMRARDGSCEFDGLELFGRFLSAETDKIVGQLLPRAAHTPRVTIDDLTIVRERWWTSPVDMPFLAEPAGAAQFAAIRAWGHQRGMPERVFYKSPQERKPCYLDFSSPVYTALFVKHMRRLEAEAHVRLEEMLPDVGDTWLTTIDGARHTCEFRMAAYIPAERPSDIRQ
jgi:hypothetical protein